MRYSCVWQTIRRSSQETLAYIYDALEDYVEAFHWYMRAAEQGSIDAEWYVTTITSMVKVLKKMKKQV